MHCIHRVAGDWDERSPLLKRSCTLQSGPAVEEESLLDRGWSVGGNGTSTVVAEVSTSIAVEAATIVIVVVAVDGSAAETTTHIVINVAAQGSTAETIIATGALVVIA